jgi:hypothetical protein
MSRNTTCLHSDDIRGRLVNGESLRRLSHRAEPLCGIPMSHSKTMNRIIIALIMQSMDRDGINRRGLETEQFLPDRALSGLQESELGRLDQRLAAAPDSKFVVDIARVALHRER